MRVIMVLNDGETWTEIEGCSLMMISETQVDALMAGVKPKDLRLEPFAVIRLTEGGDFR